MEFKDREFIPVLLGGDINTYRSEEHTSESSHPT